MEHDWKDYLSFTKKERRGILTLVVLIGISAAVPYLVPQERVDEQEIMKVVREIEEVDSNAVEKKPRQSYHKPQEKPITLFPFDPNTLDSAGWLKLGIHHRSIRTIQNYLRKGGRFRKPEDLEKIYGFRKVDYERLLPYVRIPETNSIAKRAAKFHAYDSSKHRFGKSRPPRPAPSIIDINTADTTAFIALPGIGGKLANRIVTFREKLGGFYSINQLTETYGLPDSTFQLIKPYLQYSPTNLRKININTADPNTLKQHPYIKWPIANAIVQFRQQHGPYKSLEDLKQIAILPPDLYDKIIAYISLE